jgi:hypothetical protein
MSLKDIADNMVRMAFVSLVAWVILYWLFYAPI